MQQLIITLSHHPRFDYLLQPVFASFSQAQDVYTITEVATTANKSFTDLSESEQEIVKLAECYSIKNLMKSYSRTEREVDFMEELVPATIEKYIRPFIEKKQRELVQKIIETKTPVFRRDHIKIRNFRVENALTVLPNPSRMVFIFRNEEIFTYQVKVQNETADILLYGQFFASVVTKPAVVVIGDQLHHFSDVDEKKLRPFIQKKQIEVPARNVQAYIRSFVMQCVKNYDTRGEGLTIFESHHQPVAVLTLEVDFHLQPVLNLKFHYGAHKFHKDEPYKKTVELVDDNGMLSIAWFYRDEGWERERIRLLIEGGLRFTRTNQLIVENKEDNLNTNQYGVVEWINRNGALLSSFELKQPPVTQQYYMGGIEIQLNTSSTNDWFDIHCMVCFDEVKIPFILFKHHITNNIREYALPDGRIVILPSEWYFRFGEMFRYGAIEAGTIRLNRFHFRVKELAENGSFHDRDRLSADADVALPTTLEPILRPYQVSGFLWLIYLHQNGFGGCLADDMGLGKTLQTISLLLWQYAGSSNRSSVKHTVPRQLSLFENLQADEICAEEPVMKKEIPPSLIVMPTSLIHNWLDELKKFAPTLSVYAHTGPNRLRGRAFIQSMKSVNIVLTSYGILRQDIDSLRTCHFHYVILDESQYIKNPSSLNFICVKQLQATYRLALTGTPLENALTDLWAQMDFLNEGILGKLNEFRSRFREADVILDDAEQQKLLHIIQPFILRRTKEEVAPELPSLTSEIIFCTMKEEQEAIYLKEKSKIRNALLEHASNKKGTFSAAALSGLTRLRLLANHPVISIPDYEGTSAKFEQIVEHAEILFAEGHKVLIFSSFVKHLKLLASYFDERDWPYAWLTGSTIDRQAAINTFSTDKHVHTFFISLKAGGTGLNLTAADYVFIIDPWWNPSAEMQAVSRAHRIGQKKNVTLYRFITEGTIEEKIQQLQHYKTTLTEGLIRPQFSEEEIKELLD